MTDEFLKAAKSEISSELEKLLIVLGQCKKDEDVLKKNDEMKEPLHKIKGLAPMMGKENLGEMARMCEAILTQIVKDGQHSSCIKFLEDAATQMKKVLLDCDIGDVSEFRNAARTKFPRLRDI